MVQLVFAGNASDNARAGATAPFVGLHYCLAAAASASVSSGARVWANAIAAPPRVRTTRRYEISLRLISYAQLRSVGPLPPAVTC